MSPCGGLIDAMIEAKGFWWFDYISHNYIGLKCHFIWLQWYKGQAN